MFRREVKDPPSTVLKASRAMPSPCLRGGATRAARITVCGIPGLSIRYTTEDCGPSECGVTVAGNVPGFHSANASSISRSEEHTSELQSQMRNSYAVFCLKKKKK